MSLSVSLSVVTETKILISVDLSAQVTPAELVQMALAHHRLLIRPCEVFNEPGFL